LFSINFILSVNGRVFMVIDSLDAWARGGEGRRLTYGKGWPWTPRSFIRVRHALPFYALGPTSTPYDTAAAAAAAAAAAVRRSPFAVRRSPFAVRRSPFAVRLCHSFIGRSSESKRRASRVASIVGYATVRQTMLRNNITYQ
jgi:hypothetical protein